MSTDFLNFINKLILTFTIFDTLKAHFSTECLFFHMLLETQSSALTHNFILIFLKAYKTLPVFDLFFSAMYMI